MKIITLILFTFFSAQAIAQAENDIQYVTGKLYLSLYQQADSGSTVIKSLVSGDRLEVIEIAGPYAKVVTKGDKEGWVKKGFLVKEKPAAILYKETDKALKKLQLKIAKEKENNGSIEDIKEQLALLQKENKELKQIEKIFLKQKELQQTDTKNNIEIGEKETTGNKIDLALFKAFIKEYTLFLVASFILLLLVGFRLGELKTESDVIKHFGGVKVW